MTSTLDAPSTARFSGGTRVAVSSGAIGGAAVVGCCSVGVLGASFAGLGAGTTFFALGEASPVGDRPILILAGLLVAALVTWSFMRRRVAGLPAPVARAATRRAIGISLFTGVAAYFVVMQIVIPLLFLLTGGAVGMGMFFPS
jgi:hypothetical protein